MEVINQSRSTLEIRPKYSTSVNVAGFRNSPAVCRHRLEVFAGFRGRILLFHSVWAASWESRMSDLSFVDPRWDWISYCLVEDRTHSDAEAPQLLCVCFAKKKKSLCYQDTGDGTNFNQSETEDDFSDARVKDQKPAGGFKNWGTCSIPCDVTVKLLRDEKHSVCGKKASFFYADVVSDVIITCCSACTYVRVCLCAAQLQQSLLAFGRSTRKLIRDVMEEQQRALDILSSQVKWSSALITKFENVWLFFCMQRFPHFFRSQSWWSKCRRSALRCREATLRCILANRCNPTVTLTQDSHNNKTFTHIDDKCQHISGSLFL